MHSGAQHLAQDYAVWADGGTGLPGVARTMRQGMV